ncbi:MAG: carbon-nitrogen hydrolase family protein [bacterium]|nr:carbon-nitrogen hydrolase family protein [bacterium]
MEESFRLGMGQMLVTGGQPELNLERAAAMIVQAASQRCRVVVLPECLDLGWTWPTTRAEAQPIPGTRSGILAAAARQHRLYVVAGLAERAGDRCYNAALLISPEGEILSHHRKINELTIAHGIYDTGDRLAVHHTPLGVWGVNICADNFPSSLALAHSLARMGCRLLLSPCAWAVDGDHDNSRNPYGDLWMNSYTQLATLYDMTVVGVSCVGRLTAGPWKGRKCIGCSLAVGPGGKVLAQGPYGESAEQLMVIDVETAAGAVRGADIAPMLESRGYRGP